MLTEDQARANIAANLQRIMDTRRLSQSELARMTGDDQQSISRILRGKNAPGIAFLARIAEALQTTVDYLIAPPPVESRKKSA